MTGAPFEGRTALVTGAARGIGLATAQRLAQGGARLVLWDMDGAALEAARASLGEGARGAVLDLTDAGAVSAAAEAGPADILVNNAGITGGNAKTWEIEPDLWRRVIEVNLTAPFLVARELAPGMIGRGWGRIVNVASIAGKEGNPNAAHYSASKAGLIGLTKSLGKELAGTGVLVNCVTPAAARTEIFDQMSPEHIDFMLSRIPLGRFVEPAEIAAMIAWLCSEECSSATGAVFDVSGGRAVC